VENKMIKAMPNKILAYMIEKPGDYKKSQGGIFMQDKDADVTGIRPRWFKVFSVGEKIDWITEGEYVLVDHGRWSNGMSVDEQDDKLYLLDNEGCLATQDTNPLQE
jgi:hypothetical protein